MIEPNLAEIINVRSRLMEFRWSSDSEDHSLLFLSRQNYHNPWITEFIKGFKGVFGGVTVPCDPFILKKTYPVWRQVHPLK